MDYSAIKEIENRILPNTFIVLTAKQGIQVSSGIFIPPSHDAFERAAQVWWKGIMIRLYGKRAYRRKKRLLPNITVLEKSVGGMWHIHACVRRPSHVTIEEFENIVKESWYRSAWSKRIVQVEEYLGKGIPYILKTGQDSLLVSSCCFDADAK